MDGEKKSGRPHEPVCLSIPFRAKTLAFLFFKQQASVCVYILESWNIAPVMSALEKMRFIFKMTYSQIATKLFNSTEVK
jgi:hypothetical protein